LLAFFSVFAYSSAYDMRVLPDFMKAAKEFQASSVVSESRLLAKLHGVDPDTHSLRDLGFVPSGEISRKLPTATYVIYNQGSSEKNCITPEYQNGLTATGNCVLIKSGSTSYSQTAAITSNSTFVTMTYTVYPGSTTCGQSGSATSKITQVYGALGKCTGDKSGKVWSNFLSTGQGNVPAFSASSPTLLYQSFSSTDKTCTTALSWQAIFPTCSSDGSGVSSTTSCSGSNVYSGDTCSGTPTLTIPNIFKLDTCDASAVMSDSSSEAAYEKYSCASPPPATESTKAACFSGTEELSLEGGRSKRLSEVVVGDRVLTAKANGALSFSPVVFLPHGVNVKEASFVELTTSGNKMLKATPMHLLQTCGGALAYAGSLKAGACLKTVDGDESIKSVTRVTAKGLYTAVTENEFLVVNGVVASPFAVAHGVTHAFYSLHRALYKIAPSFMKSPAVVTANALIGSAAVLGMGSVSSK